MGWCLLSADKSFSEGVTWDCLLKDEKTAASLAGGSTGRGLRQEVSEAKPVQGQKADGLLLTDRGHTEAP